MNSRADNLRNDPRPDDIRVFTHLSRTARFYPEERKLKEAILCAQWMLPFIDPYLDEYIRKKPGNHRLTYPISCDKNVQNLHTTGTLERYRTGENMSLETSRIHQFSIAALLSGVQLTEEDVDKLWTITEGGEGLLKDPRCDFSDEEVSQAFKIVAAMLGTTVPFVGTKQRRREVSTSVRRQHDAIVLKLGRRCPCCGLVEVVDTRGVSCNGAEYDHFYSNQYPDLQHTWLICKTCHDDFTYGRVDRPQFNAEFVAYQKRVQMVSMRLGSGPLKPEGAY